MFFSSARTRGWIFVLAGSLHQVGHRAFPARIDPLRWSLLARPTWFFPGNPASQEAGPMPLTRVGLARTGDF